MYKVERASNNMFGYLMYFKINLILKMNYMGLVETFFLKVFDTCVCYLN